MPFDPNNMVSNVFNCMICNVHAAEDIGTFRCTNNCGKRVCNSCWHKHQLRSLIQCERGHSLRPYGTQLNNGWGCDSIPNTSTKCLSNSSFSQNDFNVNPTNNKQRFRCKTCDFDLCKTCIDAAVELLPINVKTNANKVGNNSNKLSKLSRKVKSLIKTCGNTTRWIRLRFKVLRSLNKMLQPAIPMIDLNLIDTVNGSHENKYDWSTGQCLSKCRHLIFLKIKIGIWKKALLETKSVGSQFSLRLSRPKAWKLKRDFILNGKIDRKMNISLFSQFFKHCINSTTISNKSLRRHERLYEVKFLGEDAQDAGGPYRESWQDYCSELMSKVLPLFLPVPNEKDAKSINRDQWLPNPYPNGNDKKLKLHSDAMEFVGKMCGIAIRNELCLPFNFSSIIWKALSNDKPTIQDIYEIDASTLSITTLIRNFNEGNTIQEKIINFEELELYFCCKTLDGSLTIDLIENGSNIQVKYSNKEEYCKLLENYRLHEFDEQLIALKNGLSYIIPTKPLTLFTWEEVATFVTGKPGKMNLILLKKHTTFKRWNGDEQTILWASFHVFYRI